MFRAIIESVAYRRASQRSRKICRELSEESGLSESRIYSLLRGRRAKSEMEMKVLYRLIDMGFIRKIRNWN